MNQNQRKSAKHSQAFLNANAHQRHLRNDFLRRRIKNLVRKRRIIAPGLILSLTFLFVMVLLGNVYPTYPTAGQSDATPEKAQTTNAHLFIQQTPRLHEVFAGQSVTFNVMVQNTGNVPLETVSVTNSVATDCNRTGLGPLQPGAQESYSCSVSGILNSFLNVVTAEGTGANSSPSVTKQTDAFVKVLKPDIRILKRPTSQTVTRGATANFTIVVSNFSNTAVLLDVTVTDPLVPDCSYNPAIAHNLGPGESFDYPCKATNVQSAFTGVATADATAVGTGEIAVHASDVGWVELLELNAFIASAPSSIAEPGNLVTFSVAVTNEGSVPVTLQSLDTNQFGNVMNPANTLISPDNNSCLPSPSLPALAPSGGLFECSFMALVSGQPSNFSVILTALAEAQNGADISATTSTTVFITDVPSSLAVDVTATPPLIPEPGDTVSYSVLLLNTSEVDAIRINSLRDSRLGNLDGKGTCNVPTSFISAGSSYQCEFTDVLSGTAGQTINRTVTAAGINDDQTSNQVSGTDQSNVSIIDRPIQLVFMANIADDVVEPNNTCGKAYPLQLDHQYHFLAEDVQDVYSFTLTNQESISVELTNFVPLEGQLVVWTGTCDNLQRVGQNPDTSLDKTLNLGSQNPGFYLVHIINDGPLNNQDPYGLIVRSTP
jgi:uncharacterized repeat protein (TIGR01451 family)